MLKTALVVLSDNDKDAPHLPAICTVSKNEADQGGLRLGAAAAKRGALFIDRPYWSGNPDARAVAADARRAHQAGAHLVQLGNENNLAHEGWRGTRLDFFDFAREVRTIAPEVPWLDMPPSPSGNWTPWVEGGKRPKALHCYGNLDEMWATVQWYLDNTEGDLYITECNFAAGRKVDDLGAWVRDHFRPFLDRCSQHSRIKVVAWFAYRWNADSAVLTTLNAAEHPGVLQLLQTWQPPKPLPAPQPRAEPKPVTQTISEAGLRFIAGFEGFVGSLYNDPVGHCTVGFGHLLHLGNCDGRASEQRFRNGLTRDEGLALLRQDAARFEASIRRLITVPLAQHQFDALVSWAFNVGIGDARSGVTGSDLRKLINAGDYASVPHQLSRWNRAGGVVLRGLVERRRREGLLFSEGLYEERPMQTGKRLIIPYVSQNGLGATYGKGDCGIACLTALGRAVGQSMTVDAVGKLAGLAEGYTWSHILSHVKYVATRMGITLSWHPRTTAQHLVAELEANRTAILLVYYPLLQKRRLADYTEGHFIQVTGYEVVEGQTYFFYDDPEWLAQKDGEDIRISAEALMAAAWKTGAHFKTPGQALFLRSHTLPERSVA